MVVGLDLDLTEGHGLLHGYERVVFADAGNQGAAKRLDATGVAWHMAMRLGKRRALDKNSLWGSLLDQAEQINASVRAKVEHPFRSSNASSALPRCATRVLPRTRRNWSRCLRYPIFGWRDECCCKERRDECARITAPKRAANQIKLTLKSDGIALVVSFAELFVLNARVIGGCADPP